MWLASLVILLLSAAVPDCLGKISDELLVPLGNGAGVTGHYRTSHSGRGILAFTNIPYAEPPVGPLRFKDPVRKEPWTGYLPSNSRGDIMCPQMQTFSRLNNTSGDEDCLYLNVYVPQTPRRRSNLPVMVFIHGGGFTTGSGSVSLFDPAFILEEDVILVTLNYRLGVFGFLATFDEIFPGNWGLKDQQMALQWVQEHIQAFGGDNEEVTIFGISAGGSSVGFHLMAPHSKGLFQRAILESGTPFDSWVLLDKGRAVRNANKLFGLVGCDEEKGAALLDCMRKVSSDEVLATTYKFFEWDVDPITNFGPIVEAGDAHRPFIRQKDTKKIHDIPIMIGVTNDEGAFKSVLINGEPALIADLEENFDRIIPSVLSFSHYEEETKSQIMKKIREFYFEDSHKFNWKEDKHTYTTILADGMFVAGFDKFLQRRLPGSQSQTYIYLFNYNGESSFTDVIQGQAEEEIKWGVSHGEDMMYLFPVIKVMAPHRTMSERDHKFRQKFVRLLTDFAAHGDPVFSNEEILWNSATENYFDYLRIGNCNRHACPPQREMAMAQDKNLFAERRKFWREVELISRETVVKREKRDEL